MAWTFATHCTHRPWHMAFRVTQLAPQVRSALGLPYGLVVDDVRAAAGSG
jgi:hypothetical protein